MLLDGLSKIVGINNRGFFEWRRSGGSIELIGGDADQWSFRNIYGPLGQFKLTLEATSFPIHEAELRYELKSNGFIRIDAGCEADLIGHFEQHRKPVSANGESAQPVGLGLTSIIGLLSIVWALLNPRATLNLPGNIEFELTLTDADALRINFKTPPTITAVWGIRFTITPNQIVLREHGAEATYKAGWFSREQEWSW